MSESVLHKELKRIADEIHSCPGGEHLLSHIDELKSLIADREKKMLEFVEPQKIVFGHQLKKDGIFRWDTKHRFYKLFRKWFGEGYNQAVDDISQRAKEWRER